MAEERPRRELRFAVHGLDVHVSAWFPLMILITWAVTAAPLIFVNSLIPGSPSWPALLPTSVIATTILLASVVIHEAGHVAAAALAGHRWVLLNLGAHGVGVGFDPEHPRGWVRIARSLAGPLAQVLVCLPLAALVTAEPLFSADPRIEPFRYSVLWFPGLLGAGVALVNLLPIPGADGSKILHGIRDLLGSTP